MSLVFADVDVGVDGDIDAMLLVVPALSELAGSKCRQQQKFTNENIK